MQQNSSMVVNNNTIPSGSGSLTFNSAQNLLTFTPPDITNFITTETDPIFSASPSAGITSANISNWNSAYNWGDHSIVGYLQATNTDKANWNQSYSWGNHASAGYLTAEVDTLDSVTGRGNTTINNISVGRLTAGGLLYPNTNGTSGQVLTSDGTGNITWSTVSGGGSSIIDLSLSVNKPSIYPVKVPIDPDANGNSTFTRQSFYEWYGGALASNGNIYGAPYGSNKILKIDTVGKTATTISVSGVSLNNQSYGGAVAHPNGKIYFTPMDQGNVLEFDPVAETSSTFGTNIPAYPTVTNGWDKGIVAPNGHIYCAPDGSNQVLKIDVTNKVASLFGDTGYIGIGADTNQANGDTGSSKFCGAHLVGDKIYLVPQFANDEIVSSTSSPLSLIHI